MAGEFVRTPKRGSKGIVRYRSSMSVPLVESLLCLVSVASTVASIRTGHYVATPFAALFTAGYGYMAGKMLRRADGSRSPGAGHGPAGGGGARRGRGRVRPFRALRRVAAQSATTRREIVANSGAARAGGRASERTATRDRRRLAGVPHVRRWRSAAPEGRRRPRRRRSRPRSNASPRAPQGSSGRPPRRRGRDARTRRSSPRKASHGHAPNGRSSIHAYTERRPSAKPSAGTDDSPAGARSSRTDCSGVDPSARTRIGARRKPARRANREPCLRGRGHRRPVHDVASAPATSSSPGPDWSWNAPGAAQRVRARLQALPAPPSLHVSVVCSSSRSATAPATRGAANEVPAETPWSVSICWHAGSAARPAPRDNSSRRCSAATRDWARPCAAKAPTIAAAGAMMSGFAIPGQRRARARVKNQHGSPHCGHGLLSRPKQRQRQLNRRSIHAVLLIVQLHGDDGRARRGQTHRCLRAPDIRSRRMRARPLARPRWPGDRDRPCRTHRGSRRTFRPATPLARRRRRHATPPARDSTARVAVENGRVERRRILSGRCVGRDRSDPRAVGPVESDAQVGARVHRDPYLVSRRRFLAPPVAMGTRIVDDELT